MHTIQKKFDPRIITEVFFPNDFSFPRGINYGRCFIWASFTNLVFPEALLFDTCEHAFIKMENKFYDSERLEGVEDWTDLPAAHGGHIGQCGLPWCPHRNQDPNRALHLPRSIFRNHWRNQTYRFGTSWDEIDRRAANFLKDHA